jgi:hypothetical protein
MLEPIRECQKEHILVLRAGRESSLTIEQESDVASNLTFLFSRSNNSIKLIVIGIEEDHDG